MIGTSKWPLSCNLMMVQSLDGKPTAAFASAVFVFCCSTSNFFSASSLAFWIFSRSAFCFLILFFCSVSSSFCLFFSFRVRRALTSSLRFSAGSFQISG